MKDNGNSYTETKSVNRGKKMVRSTGRDDSSYGNTSLKGIGDKMKGSVGDLSHSIKDGRVPND